MIKFLTIIVSVFIFISCDKQQQIEQAGFSDSTCYRGKLVLVGLCGNAVVQVLDDKLDPAFYEKTWKDESTGIVYQNVMGNANYCTFPGDLKEDQEFYFRIELPTSKPLDCMTCKAISPSPQTRQFIQICNKTP